MNPLSIHRVNTTQTEETAHMLMYENLARARQLEAERVARTHRLVRRLSAAKRWDRVSKWAAKRADRAAVR
ncbi:MAG: hypothetical protein M3548_00440 [Actinomycetota bacterium]|nr:hypothetical protein [Actinomycetota bacterium]